MDPRIVFGSCVTVLLGGAFGSLGCQDPPYGERSPFRDQSTPESRAGITAAPAESAPLKQAELTDGQIITLLDASNDREIEASKVAIDKAKDDEVKAFAKTMVEHHEAAKKAQQDLVDKLAVVPAELEDAKKLRLGTLEVVARLEKTPDEEFDAAYIDEMVADHQAALELLDQRILPSVHDPDLETHIATDVRRMVDNHLEEARTLAKKFAPKSSAPPIRAAALVR
ncbi:MAG: DUF4142 domain-containing protein [Polyangiaceae bacterium]|nr:DUF4142 domain-containing protein [Polyangiaceae bacterium]